MATTLDEVRNNLPPDAVDQGWTDEKITAMVGSDLSLAKIMMTYWSGRAAETHKYVSVSESGSTRSLSDVYNNAVEMLKFWSAQVDKENSDAIAVETSRRPISYGRLRRV